MVSRVQSTNGISTAAFASPVAVGDLIIACGAWNGSPVSTFSDNVNSGNYNTIGAVFQENGVNVAAQMFYKICNAAGTPTLSEGGTNTDRITAAHYNGFIGTPTLPSGDTATFSNNGAQNATTVTLSTINASVNNEFFVGVLRAASTGGVTHVSPFGGVVASAGFQQYDDILAVDPNGVSSGTGVAFSINWTNSVLYSAACIGFYDSATNPLLGQTTPTTGNAIGLVAGDMYWITSTAFAGGTAAALNVALQSVGSATGLLLGLYDQNGNLLTSGTVASPAVGLNTASIAATPIAYGQQYSISVQATTSAAINVCGNLTGIGPTHKTNTPNTVPSVLPGSPFVDAHGLMTLYATGGLGAAGVGTPLGGPARTSWHWRGSGSTS